MKQRVLCLLAAGILFLLFSVSAFACEHYGVTVDSWDLVLRNRVEPQIGVPGYEGDKCCPVCGEVIERGQVLPALEEPQKPPVDTDPPTTPPSDTPAGDTDTPAPTDTPTPTPAPTATAEPAESTTAAPAADTDTPAAQQPTPEAPAQPGQAGQTDQTGPADPPVITPGQAQSTPTAEPPAQANPTEQPVLTNPPEQPVHSDPPENPVTPEVPAGPTQPPAETSAPATDPAPVVTVAPQQNTEEQQNMEAPDLTAPPDPTEAPAVITDVPLPVTDPPNLEPTVTITPASRTARAPKRVRFSKKYPYRRVRMNPQPGIEAPAAGELVWPEPETPFQTLFGHSD